MGGSINTNLILVVLIDMIFVALSSSLRLLQPLLRKLWLREIKEGSYDPEKLSKVS